MGVVLRTQFPVRLKLLVCMAQRKVLINCIVCSSDNKPIFILVEHSGYWVYCSMKKQFIINGSSITDIPTFYEEINRVFMTDEDWKIGHSLDALNDLMYGGFGAMKNTRAVTLLWLDADKSREALGPELTRAYYEEKLKPGSPYNKKLFKQKLLELENGKGETYFEIILSVISGHKNIQLILR